MGFFDALGTVLDRVGGAAQGFFMSGGNPIGAVTGAVAVEQAKKRTKQLERAEFMYQQDPGLAAGNVGFNQQSLSSPGFLLRAARFGKVLEILAVFCLISVRLQMCSD